MIKDIKIKDKSKNIKILDKSLFLTGKIRKTIDTINYKEDNSTSNFAQNAETINPLKKIVSSGIKFNYKNSTKMAKFINNKIKEKNKIIKMQNVAKNSAKRTKKAAEETTKTFYRTYKIVKKIIPFLAKIVFQSITFILGLGIYGIIIIISIMITAVILGSYQGILFTNENINDISMKEVIHSLNNEMASKINTIKNTNAYDDYKIISNKADWKEILSLYSVKMSNNNQNEVITLDSNKKNEIRNIFWSMNNISYEVVEENLSEEYDVDNQETKKVLYIYINSESLESMMDIYYFTQEQKIQVKDLLSGHYDDLWLSVIYGIPLQNTNDIIQVALSQVGQVGGEPYWRWYGFDSRVEWCAIFVSWVLNQVGIDEQRMPKFAVVSTGVNWFKAIGAWHDSTYKPSAGDIIFFDWEVDGKVNHVGIVEYSDNDYVYTIEGNSNGDMCRQKKYALNSNVIYGYGSLYQ